MTMEQEGLSPAARQEIEAIIAKTVPAAMAYALKEAAGEDGLCMRPCTLEQETAKKLGHFFGMVCDLGDGDLGRGIERLRTAGKITRVVDSWSHQAGGLLVKSVLLAILALIGWGIVHFVQQGGKP